MQTKKAFWQSANFWFGLIAIAASLFGMGFPEDAFKQIAAAIIALFSAGNIAYHYLRSIDWEKQGEQIKGSLSSYGFWASIIAFAAGILPVLPVPELQELVKAILSGDTSLIIQAAFALLLVVVKLIKPGMLTKT